MAIVGDVRMVLSAIHPGTIVPVVAIVSCVGVVCVVVA